MEQPVAPRDPPRLARLLRPVQYFAGAVRSQDALLAERIDRAYRKAIEEIAGEFSSEGVEGSPFTLINMGQRRQIADASLQLRRYLIQARKALELSDD